MKLMINVFSARLGVMEATRKLRINKVLEISVVKSFLAALLESILNYTSLN